MSEFEEASVFIAREVAKNTVEGVVANTDKESEEKAIKKLTEDKPVKEFQEDFDEEEEDFENTDSEEDDRFDESEVGEGGFKESFQEENGDTVYTLLSKGNNYIGYSTTKSGVRTIFCSGRWSGAGLFDVVVEDSGEFAQFLGDVFLGLNGKSIDSGM